MKKKVLVCVFVVFFVVIGSAQVMSGTPEPEPWAVPMPKISTSDSEKEEPAKLGPIRVKVFGIVVSGDLSVIEFNLNMWAVENFGKVHIVKVESSASRDYLFITVFYRLSEDEERRRKLVESLFTP